MVDHFLFTHIILKASNSLLDLHYHLKSIKQTVMSYSKSKKYEPTVRQFWFNKKEKLQQQLNRSRTFKQKT